MIYTRADAEKEFMGLTTFAGNQPTLKEAIVAKNYLDEKELRAMDSLYPGIWILRNVRQSVNRQ